jgi:hypothetical protein
LRDNATVLCPARRNLLKVLFAADLSNFFRSLIRSRPRATSGELGHHDRMIGWRASTSRAHACIATTSGLTPMMFITRVRL